MSSKKSFVALAALSLLLVGAIPANAATKAAAKPTTKATAKAAAPKAAAPKPAVSTPPRAGGFGGGQNSAAFAKYTACLAKAGIKLPSFGGGRGFGGGTRPTGAPATGTAPRPRPTFSLSPAQQKAFTACAALRPNFGGFGGAGGGNGKGGGIAPGGIAPKTGTSAAYIACLNTHGLPVQTPADIAGLDNQNTKVLAAEKACAGK